MDKEINSEETTSVTKPLIQNQETKKESTTVDNNKRGRINRLSRWLRRYVYIWAAAFIAGVCGLLFGYQLAIIGGALLQLKSEFCMGVLQNEVSANEY